MGKIKSAIVSVICFSLFGFMAGRVSAQQEIILPIDGEVYHMITSPVLPEDPAPQVSLEDNLGAYNINQWRLFRWYEAESRYIELKTQDWDPMQHDFDFGRGYWIISKNPTDIDIQGEPAVFNFITLKGDGDGWNQIGNIYLQEFTIGMFPTCNLWVRRKSGGVSFQLNDPLNPYTNVTMQEYIGGSSYTDIGDEPGEKLETGKGYWLKNLLNEDVVLSFAPGGLASVSAANSPNFPSQDFFVRVAQQEDPPDPPPGVESSSSLSFSGGSASGGCFITTAAYRDYGHPNVQLLRKFRDQYFLTNSFGRIFVDMYYRYSPTLAKSVAGHSSMKALVRFNLMPIVGLSSLFIKMNVYGFLVVFAFPIVMCFLLLGRSGGGGWRCKPKFSINSEEGKRKR
jgi:hypothetical protein